MITDETFVGLVAAACTDPDANSPRLCLADWLNDNDHTTADPEAASAWAAYIRWDCGGRTGTEPDGLLRIIALAGWWWSDPSSVARDADITIGRGFPSRMTMGWAAWERFGHLLSWHPSELEKSGRACPPTACPGVEVTIRGEPDVLTVAWDMIDAHRRLSERWPGVKAWHLPDVPRMTFGLDHATLPDYSAIEARIMSDMVRRYLAVTPAMLGPTAGNYADAEVGMLAFNERLHGGPVRFDPRAVLHTRPADTEE